MQNIFAIFSSTGENKDRTRIPFLNLDDGIWQTSEYGVPANLSHDLHRPVGWAVANGLYFDVNAVLVSGHFKFPESEQEADHLTKARDRYIIRMMNEHIDPFHDAFLAALGPLHDIEKGRWFFNGIVLFGYDNIAWEAFPILQEHIVQDKDGLVDLSILLTNFNYLSQGVFRHKSSELCVLCHPYFRKAQSIYNHFHWTFLDELVAMKDRPNLRIKVKLDPNFVGFAPSFTTSFEYEYWWGPKYRDDIAGIPAGLTVFGSDDFERLYYALNRTEFVWKPEKPLYTLELEEVINEPSPADPDRYSCRYVHSIYNEDDKAFQHFDGAIRGYTSELMIERLDKKMTEMGRQTEYTKLFRIDGALSLSDWKSLVTNYLQGNPQIYEYFGLDKPGVARVPEHTPESEAKSLVPYTMKKGDGIRLFISYHQQSDTQGEERSIDSFDVISLQDRSIKVIEYFAMEIKKALERIGGKITFPTDCAWVLPEDYYVNVPQIFHSNSNTQLLLDQTLQAYRLLLQALAANDDDQILSLGVSWNMNGKKVAVSFMGHHCDLLDWLMSFDHIPVTRDMFRKWLVSQQSDLAKRNVNAFPVDPSCLVTHDGLLYIKRKSLRKFGEPTADLSKPTKIGVKFNPEFQALTPYIEAGDIAISPVNLIKTIRCEKTGLAYFESPYSAILDDDLTRRIVEIEPIGCFFTDRPLIRAY